eukprot:CAMPEP_0115007152 /NCGR_PEP_ID=MMETSP0216-20121206/20975_1 /TAXON_ID=223996 /ORGANISM="Protocruzia adherens, Strain Boccale" /LENGTH=91 /DNA_ID=CAMNT_0002373971 /DNA_START=94 /DNA_END=369 /DNA_ORIENTATION=-
MTSKSQSLIRYRQALGKTPSAPAEVTVAKGDSAPVAFEGKKVFSSDYKPWGHNYKGNAAFAGLFFFLCLVCYNEEESYKRFVGRRERKFYE